MKQLTTIEEYILLSVHHLHNNAYLISIRDYLNEKAGIDLAIGSVFAPLNRLHRNGLLTTVSGDPSPKVGGRAIKFYRLTDSGKEALRERQEVMDTMWLGFRINDAKG
ncbi:PadR family transcriptional regulator [candidate division KSB1 bacterium]